MKLQEAIALLRNAGFSSTVPQTWLDLGCGAGTFTYALAHSIPSGSVIYAVDQNPQTLQTEAGNKVEVKFVLSDFETVEFIISEELTGILMGNSLHYVKDKSRLLNRLISRFPSVQQMIVIEYDSHLGNQWVPYPITYLQLQRLVSDAGFQQIQKIAERPSIYGQGNMYVASIR